MTDMSESQAPADGEAFVAGETTDRTTGRTRQKIAMWQTARSSWAFFEWTFTKLGRPLELQIWPEGASIAAITFKARPEDPFVRHEFPVGTRALALEPLNHGLIAAGFNIAVIMRTKPGQRVCGQLTMEWPLDS